MARVERVPTYKDRLCCLVHPLITCESCGHAYCKEHCGYIEGLSDEKNRGGLLKCHSECFDKNSLCNSMGHDWFQYTNIFRTLWRSCKRDCGISDQVQVVEGKTELWVYP